MWEGIPTPVARVGYGQPVPEWGLWAQTSAPCYFRVAAQNCSCAASFGVCCNISMQKIMCSFPPFPFPKTSVLKTLEILFNCANKYNNFLWLAALSPCLLPKNVKDHGGAGLRVHLFNERYFTRHHCSALLLPREVLCC